MLFIVNIKTKYLYKFCLIVDCFLDTEILIPIDIFTFYNHISTCTLYIFVYIFVSICIPSFVRKLIKYGYE